MKIKNSSRTMWASKNAQQQTLRKCVYRTTQKGVRVVQGPSHVVRPGATVTVRQWGKDEHVTITSVGRTFERHGIELVYGRFEE